LSIPRGLLRYSQRKCTGAAEAAAPRMRVAAIARNSGMRFKWTSRTKTPAPKLPAPKLLAPKLLNRTAHRAARCCGCLGGPLRAPAQTRTNRRHNADGGDGCTLAIPVSTAESARFRSVTGYGCKTGAGRPFARNIMHLRYLPEHTHGGVRWVIF
jgi:hypothetical protein